MTLVQILQILVLAVVQGLAELLPVSSSAHVTVAARLMGYETRGVFAWTFLLIMLHTGTMFSVLIYFWSRWKRLLTRIPELCIATICTAVVALPTMRFIEKVILKGEPIETLFQNLPLMAIALAAAGLLIIFAGLKDEKSPGEIEEVNRIHSAIIGVIQGISLLFRGFSRSGSTISVAMLLRIARTRAEEFSFALAVILTPPLIGWEVRKLIKERAEDLAQHPDSIVNISQLLLPGLIGMVASFLAGLVALKWLSNWLEHGRWKFFGFYCLVAAAVVVAINFRMA